MAGLLNTQGAGVVAEGFNGEDVEGEPNVTPEEQAEYDMFVKNAMEFIYTEDEKILPDVMKRLATGKPVDALAQTAVWVVGMVESSAKSSGKEISDDVVFHGGREILEQLVEVAEAGGGHDFTEKEIEAAWYQALDMYREAASGEGGRFDPQAASDEFIALNEADQEGRADDIMPGFSQLAQKATVKVQEAEEEGDPMVTPEGEA